MPTKLNILKFVYTCLVKIVLEVFGAAGAVWGFFEVTNLRNESTNEVFRYVCGVVAVLFFLRFCVERGLEWGELRNEKVEISQVSQVNTVCSTIDE